MTLQDRSQSQTSEWQAEQLRGTVFFVPGAPNFSPNAWWSNVVGGSPEEERSRAQEGTIQQFGQLADGQLNVVWRPDRVDWRIVPNMARLTQPIGGFPVLGNYSEKWAEFTEFSIRGLSNCPDSVRLAFGAVMVKRVDGPQAGYLEFSRYLPNIDFSFTNAIDFLYQINRLRMSKEVETIVINRLTKWSMAIGGAIGISLSPDMGVVVPSTPPEHACRLELDINTAPSGTPVARSAVAPLFRELVNLGTEIAENGDVP